METRRPPTLATWLLLNLGSGRDRVGQRWARFCTQSGESIDHALRLRLLIIPFVKPLKTLHWRWRHV
jgi:hypothetical protein